MDTTTAVPVAVPAQTLTLPASLHGRYALLGALGSGGMGRVLRAYDARLMREVALKQVHVGGDELGLVEEARAMARLSHRNVVAVYDVYVDEPGAVTVAMELVRGGSMAEWLRAKPEKDEILAAFLEAGRGLAAAHEVGLIHRDFKPNNVLRSAKGEIKVTDFGLAQPPPPDGREIEAPAIGGGFAPYAGTPHYMAPEQLAGASATFASDQYAFCLALLETLMGAPAFPEGRDATRAAKQRALSRFEIPGVEDQVVSALRRGLDPRPDQRWPDMNSLLRELRPEPRSRWRRWLGAVVACAALVALWFAFSGSASPCATAGAPVDREWDAGRARSIRDAFAATGRVDHARAAADSVAALDEYAGRLRSEHRAMCEAADARPALPPGIRERRMACLSRAKAELRAAVAVLSTADTPTVDRAARVIDRLTPPGECEQRAFATSETPAPSDQAKVVEPVRAATIAAQTLVEAGRFDEAETRLADVLTQSESLRHDATRLDYQKARSTVVVRRGSDQEASDAATDTLRGLLGEMIAGQHWRLAAQTAQALTNAVGVQQNRHREGALLGQLAVALARANSASPVLELLALRELGATQTRAGDFAAAEATLEQALERATNVGTAHSSVVAGVYSELIVLRNRQGRYAEAETLSRKLLADTRQRLGEKHARIPKILGNMANAILRQGRYDDAHETFQTAKGLAREIYGAKHPINAKLTDGMGLCRSYQERFAEAEVHLKEALALMREAYGEEDPRTALTWNNLARVQLKQGRLEQARASTEMAVEIAQRRLAVDHPNRLLYQQNLAEVYGQLGRWRDAADLLETVAPHRDRLRTERYRAMFDFNVAKVKIQLGDRRAALELAEQAKAAFALRPAISEEDLKEVDAFLRRHRRR